MKYSLKHRYEVDYISALKLRSLSFNTPKQALNFIKELYEKVYHTDLTFPEFMYEFKLVKFSPIKTRSVK
jgi:hypothetical protein